MKNNTLHLYNHQNDIKLDSYLKLINSNDAVVLFSRKSIFENSELQHSLLMLTNKVYLVETKKDYSLLVDLLAKYKRTFTWK